MVIFFIKTWVLSKFNVNASSIVDFYKNWKKLEIESNVNPRLDLIRTKVGDVTHILENLSKL